MHTTVHRLLSASAAIAIRSPAAGQQRGVLSDSAKARGTIEAINLIEAGEQRYRTTHARFTQHLADLLPANPKLAGDLALGLAADGFFLFQPFHKPTASLAGKPLTLISPALSRRVNET